MRTCAYCTEQNCHHGNLENLPKNCPTLEDQTEIKALYQIEENVKIAHQSALVEALGYCEKTRLEEIMDFADRCFYKKLGIAFCVGLSHEAHLLSQVFRHHGFEVESVVCKNGSIPKEFIGIKEEEKIHPNTYEPMCNPIGQAYFLNEAKTDLNIVLGLCVGHDSLFFKYSQAPVTVFAVKDRVLAHNPLGALYLSHSYYKKKLFK